MAELPSRQDLVDAGKINPHARYQSGLSMADVYPHRDDGLCACGCERPLSGRRRRWASDGCRDRALDRLLVLKGDSGWIRRLLWRTRERLCESCERFLVAMQFEAHHRVPVSEGGGGCTLDGYAMLCQPCHKDEHRSSPDPAQLDLPAHG